VTEALVLAGGLGTRLAAEVPGVPKPMAPVAGRPFLEWLLGSLQRQGVRRVVLSLGHLADVVVRHFGPRFQGLDLVYEIETEPLGTGGAIRRALARVEGETALVVNGDTYLALDVPALMQRWQASLLPTIVGCRVDDTSRYGRLRIDGTRLVAFEEKGVAGPGWINSGHYLLPRRLFDDSPLPAAFSFESAFVVPRLAAHPFEVFFCEGPFIDIGVPEDYRRAQTDLPRWL
jgi:D-glycero-alpha-D-manno-heptose 1-phosphate guanylyltransferase